MVIIVIGLVAAAFYLAQKVVYLRFWSKELSVSLKFKDETIRAGEYTMLTQIIENRKWLPLPALKVKFQCSGALLFSHDKSARVSDLYYRNDLFSLMPYCRIIRNHKVFCPHRGYYVIRGFDIVGADLFLIQEMVRSHGGETWLYVIPALLETKQLDTMLQKISGEMAHRRHLLTDPFAFRGIREYTPDDEVKTINWKASAKSDDLKVNIHDYTAVSSVSIFLNTRQLSTSVEQVEKAISIGAYLKELYLNNGITISIYANGRDIINGNILVAEEIRDRNQLGQIHKMLARIDLNQEAEPFTVFEERMNQQKDRMIIAVSPDWHKDIQEQFGRIDGKQDFIWLCPCRKESDIQVNENLKSRTFLIPD